MALFIMRGSGSLLIALAHHSLLWRSLGWLWLIPVFSTSAKHDMSPLA